MPGIPPGAATINQGNLPPYIAPNLTDMSALYNEGLLPSVVTDFHIHNHYERDNHRYMMGISSPGGFNGASVAFVQLAAPTLLWVADWTGCRFLEKAMIPDPTAVTDDWVLLDSWLEPAQIIIAPNGTTPLFRITGTYVFGNQNPGTAFYSNVTYPVAPWFNSTGITSLRTISPGDLVPGLITPAITNPGGIGPGIIQG